MFQIVGAHLLRVLSFLESSTSEYCAKFTRENFLGKETLRKVKVRGAVICDVTQML